MGDCGRRSVLQLVYAHRTYVRQTNGEHQHALMSTPDANPNDPFSSMSDSQRQAMLSAIRKEMPHAKRVFGAGALLFGGLCYLMFRQPMPVGQPPEAPHPMMPPPP